MNKAILIVLVLFSQRIFAQDVSETNQDLKKTAVSIIPQSFFGSGIEAALEQMVGSKLSFKVYGGFYTADDHYWYNDFESMTQYKLEVQPRIYINSEDRGIEGLFFAGSVNYRHLKLDDYKDDITTPDLDAEALGIGLNFGQQIIANSGFSFDWFVGGSLVAPLNEYNKSQAHIGVINPYKRGIVPKFGISLGYAF